MLNPSSDVHASARALHAAARLEAIAKALRQPDEWIHVDVHPDCLDHADLELELIAKRLMLPLAARRRGSNIEVRFPLGG